jgi:hypothetical protein
MRPQNGHAGITVHGALLEEPVEAERLFRETRDGFVLQGNGYDSAMASLDLLSSI